MIFLKHPKEFRVFPNVGRICGKVQICTCIMARICMKSYPKVVSFFIIVLAICICISVFGKINFETYISENKGFGDSGYEF
jgi:hypothetical protein